MKPDFWAIWSIGRSVSASNCLARRRRTRRISGQAADYLGMAIASYEWLATVTLVAVAFFFLPTFLRSGIFTMPEFLERRYDAASRTVMSLLMMVTYVAVTIAAVIYSGAKTADVFFSGQTILGVPINVTTASWFIGLLAAVYVAAGGLKACAWADLLQGSALILGGGIVLYLAMRALGNADPAAIGLGPEMANAGSLERFHHLNGHKLHMVLPSSDQYVPWTALVIGLCIPNFYYWGLDHFHARPLSTLYSADGPAK